MRGLLVRGDYPRQMLLEDRGSGFQDKMKAQQANNKVWRFWRTKEGRAGFVGYKLGIARWATTERWHLSP